jgi:predicted solute-binding protein
MAEDIHIPPTNSGQVLRLGYHDRANLLHLLYPLKAGWVAPESPWKLEIMNDLPAALLDALLGGRLDAALVTPVGAQLHGDRIMPLGGWGLAAEGATGTALLLAPQRIDLIDGSDLSILPEAVNSTAEQILRTILKPYYGIAVNLRKPGEPEYSEQGARLVYSDEGARQAASNPAGWVAEDMGLAWWVLTGLPMVWELLCVPRDLQARKPGAPEALQTLMSLSQRSAGEQNATIVQEAASRLKIDQKRVKELFARQRYTLGQKEQNGLAHFLAMVGRGR